MRHVRFIINTAFKNKFGNLYFLRFIFNNFKNKIFMGYKSFLNNVWGEKWIFVKLKKILELLRQLKNVKSKSTRILYVKHLAFGVASLSFFFILKFKFLNFFVQKSISKFKTINVLFFSLKSKINDRTLNQLELEQVGTLQRIFNLAQ